MKINSLLIKLLVVATLTACSTSGDPIPDDSTGCSEAQVVPVSAHGIGAAEALTADQLFARNSINHSNFRYVRYSRDSTQTYFPPYAKFENQVVSIEEYTNGLPIFTGNVNFIFKNGLLNFQAGSLSSGTGLNSTPTLKPGQLRGLFFATIAQFDPVNTSLNNQCVSAQFGYYDLNAGTSNHAENLVKAWKVTVKNTAYPFAYYQDNGGQLIYYDNGIRTVH